MCGRFVQSSSLLHYAGVLGIEAAGLPEHAPRYNVAPTDAVFIARDEGAGAGLAEVRWGLVPHWSQGPDRRYSMINARAETVHERAAYRDPFRHRRCIVPADGFYEWRAECNGKQPYYIHRADGEPLLFAGLWDRWQGEGRTIESCTIVVGEANAAVQPIHDRMPVALTPEGARQWLDPGEHDTQRLRDLLAPAPAEAFAYHPVSKRVNRPDHDGPELTEPAATGCPPPDAVSPG